MIRTEQVCKTYNPGRPDEREALHGVSLRIAPGEVAVVRGPSGSGKTTLLSLLGCMSRPSSGKVWVEGKNVAKLSERFLAERRRETFGFIFQQFHLIRELSVLDNVLVPLYPTDLGFGQMKAQAERALEAVGLTGRNEAKAKQLSGGEQQRVAVARALVGDPKVVIADEPTAHLDQALSRELLSLLDEVSGQGRTLLIATHDPLVYEHPFIDRVIDMQDGRLTGEALQ